MSFNIELPINHLSLGQVSFGVLHELWRRGENPNIFPNGPIELRAYDLEPEFDEWLKKCLSKSLNEFNKTQTSLSIWHINGSHKRISDKNILWTVHETDSVTQAEKNILSCWDHVFVTSNYTHSVFAEHGIDVEVCPNYFDNLHLHKIDRKYRNMEDIVTFGLLGKLEKRKRTLEIMVAWAKCFGNNEKFRLNCCIFNHFVSGEDQTKMISDAFGGQIPWNINLLPFQQKNSDYNQVLNSIDIDLSGLSGAEGWNLPCFNMLCLGKQAIVLNAHAHKDFADENNSILIEPHRKQEIYDGLFFKENLPFNQGNMFSWKESDVIAAMKKSVELASKPNEAGEKLKEKFNVEETVNKLLQYI